MSLLTRMWLSVVLATALALLGSLVVNVLTARSYLSQQLYAQGNDSAAALALSMSQSGPDAAMQELMVSALFDSGHFESISLRGVGGEVLVERHNTAVLTDAPGWFVNWVPLKAEPGSALVSSGWKQIGVVEVRASTRFAYGALWKGAVNLALILLAIGVALGVAMSLLMAWAWRPLRQLVLQAEAIGKRQFMVAPEPKVKEMRVVVRAMNAMVQRLQAMFAEQAARVEALRADANRDALTGLPNRSLFMGRLREALNDEEAPFKNALLVCRINDLAGVNARLGRERGDGLIQAVAAILDLACKACPEAELARLNGAEFGLMLPATGGEDVSDLTRQLERNLHNLYLREYTDVSAVAALAWTGFTPGESVSAVMARIDSGLTQAQADGSSPVTPASPPTPGRMVIASPKDWRQLLDQAVADDAFALAAYPVVDCQGRSLHDELMLRLRLPTGEHMPAAQFMPAALRFGRGAELDRVAIRLAIARLHAQGGDVAVNLSPLSLEQPEFLSALDEALAGLAGAGARLWFELSERSLSNEHGFAAVSDLAEVLGRYGCKLGVDHFGRHFAAMPRLHSLRLNYLKLDGAFIADIDGHQGNQRFVKSLVDIAGSLDIEVIAGQVTSDAEWQTLALLGVRGITGPAVARRAQATQATKPD